MTKLLKLGVAAVLLGSSVNCTTRTNRSTFEIDHRLVEEEVRLMLDSYRSESNSSRWDSMMTYYVDDSRFTWVEDGQVRYRSADEILRALQAFPPNMKLTTKYDETEIFAISNDAASVVTAFETNTADLNGQGFSFGGMVTMTVVRVEDGWKILNGHTSGPKPRGQY